MTNGNFPTDPYERVQAEALNAISHGGYINPQNRRGGYINPQGGFAFLPFLAPLVATILPDAIKWIGKKISGKGINNITGGLLHTSRPLNM